MKNLFDETGTLEIVIGRGTISAFEVANLSEHDIVVVTDRDAGSAVDLLFNGRFIGSGEVVFLEGNIIGARIVEIGWNRPSLPFSGTAETITELLEFQLRLSSVQSSLGELRGAGENTIINFGVVMDREKGIELVVAGTTVARGAIRRPGELRFGIEITTVEAEIGLDFPTRTTGTVAEKTGEKDSGGKDSLDHIMLLDKYSKNQVHNVAIIHERIAANLRRAFPELSEWGVRRIDQVSYRELVTKWIARNEVVLLESEPRGNSPAGVEHRDYFIQPASIDQTVEKGVAERIAASQMSTERSVPLGRIVVAYPPKGVFSSIIQANGGAAWQEILSSLRGGWKQRYAMAYPTHMATSFDELAELFTDMDHFLIGLIGVDESAEVLTLAYPSAYVERIANLLE